MTIKIGNFVTVSLYEAERREKRGKRGRGQHSYTAVSGEDRLSVLF